ncbi:hypothetical protein GCM10010211_24400 [Streptomyces albospinus]|uniref:Uncharacterized protein n=1 Tax=Streptomyces albospinus TaxID=285515 RepID=A0ABQ2UYJ7_9ACTN|nr:hypothetical protein GCM10010211_24400 [Streptomyces albospinus]
MGDRGDLEDAVAARLQVGADHVGEVLAVGDVDLVQDDHPRPVAETAVLRQLLLDDVEVGDRVAVRLQGRGVQDVDQHLAALDMPQELQAQPLALAGTRDQARDVRDRVDRGTGRDHTQIGHQRGEGIVRDLRLGRGEHRDQRGLAGAGVADQRHIGDGLQLQHDVPRLAGLAEQREAGGLAAGGGQRGVAEAAATALARDEGGALAHQVGQHLAVPVQHDRAVRDRQDQVLAVLALAVVARAGLAVGGLAVRVVVVVEEGGDVLVDDQDHVAAPAAVAAVGAAERLELLPVNGGTAVASVTRGDVQLDAVHEGGHGGDASRSAGLSAYCWDSAGMSSS